MNEPRRGEVWMVDLGMAAKGTTMFGDQRWRDKTRSRFTRRWFLTRNQCSELTV